jgi:hypothetical protein
MFPLKNPPDNDKMAEYLKGIAKLRGEFAMEDRTREYFDKWYRALCNQIDDQQIKDPTGTLNRFDDSVLKVAMLISLAKAPELIITQEALEEAVTDCERLIGNVRRVTMGRGKSVWSTQKALLLQELIARDNHQITRQMLHRKYYLHANVNEWDEVVKSLVEGGHIVIDNLGNQVIYRMPDKAVSEWTKHLSGGN